MDTVLRFVGFLSIPLVALSVFLMVRQLGRDRPLRDRDLLLSLLFSVGVLVLFILLLDAEASAIEWLLGALGFAVGALVGRATPLRAVAGEVYARGTPWAFGVWVIGFGYAQLAVLGVIPGGDESGLSAMFLATGVSIGTVVATTIRRSRLATSAAGQSASAAAGSVCPNCGSPTACTGHFCGRCGWTIVLRATESEAVP